eukprot:TRINITY_DN4822_c0_g2_i1.p1 TRINITY_DN4822_c0_g2~~TRINITY_DN4822_c0_g2_i1.p1  ORF type:complete len:444 (+),score=104.61 TRINITY_DN4822_c0_g2_i1:98-1429(+)
MESSSSSSTSLRVAFIGAGEVNFGSETVYVPWSHARRLHTLADQVAAAGKDGGSGDGGVQGVSEIVAVGVADVNLARAQDACDKWRAKAPALFKDVKGYDNYIQMLKDTQPNAVIIGLPPFAHGGSDASGRPGCEEWQKANVELVCARMGVHMLVEKPLSCFALDEVSKVESEVSQLAADKGLIVSVAYMFRYLKAVEKMREILAAEGQRKRTAAGLGEGTEREKLDSVIAAVLLRYNSAYAAIQKSMWWDMRLSGGPIVEQCTHFVDIARHFAGEIDNSTLTALSIPPPTDDSPLSLSYLENVPVDVVSGKPVEQGLSFEHRIPRATTAQWKFKSGAVCSLTHANLMHGAEYETAIEIWSDNLRLLLSDPYQTCKLSVSRKGKEQEVFEFGSDDPYYNELRVFLTAVATRNAGIVRSSYGDAYKTYATTWAIRLSSEKNNSH